MRAGGCAAQQTLSAEAASVLKQSLSLSRRRGHAQVTPLHVAATLLSSRSSLLRRACLKSQPHQPSHPLQCRALELCFNVALNRLPASPSPLLHAQPSLSNALIAALKRAQAHQRRGSIEQHQHHQQTPLIAVKVELDQLILSILDDPSVSRVMREAGFSSTAVKNNLEDSTSVFHCGGIYSTPSSPPTLNPCNTNSFFQNHFLFSPQKNPDVKVVLEVLLGKKRRNTVIVGDSLSMAETLVTEVMHMVEKGEVPEELKSAQLIKFQFSSVPLMLMSKEEVDSNVVDLKRKVERLGTSGRSVIVYIGDLKWAVEREDHECSSTGYSPIDHFIAEIGKLVSWYNTSSMRVWLIATANYQTYIKCQMKQPPLDLQWALQPVSIPSAGLGLSLNATSGRDSRISMSENSSPDKKVSCLKEELGDGLTCCPECISNYEKEAASSQLPYWLKSHTNTTLHKEDLDELRKKYNKLCQNVHLGGQDPHNLSSVMSNHSYLGRNHYYSSSYPCWPNKNNIFADPETISFARPPNQTASSLPRFRRQQSCHIEFSFSNGASKNQSEEPNLDSLKEMELDKEVKITLALGNSTYIDAKKRDKVGVDVDLCKENVPWQLDTIPLIIEAISQDRFVLIQGNDVIGKRRLGVAVAESVFGSSDLLVRMNMRSNQETGIHSEEMVEKALRNHVLLIEDVDFADHEFTKFLVECFEGREKGDLGNAIFILTMDGDTSEEDINSVIPMKLVVQEINHDHKRKADWDYPMRGKSSKNSETDEVSSNAKREFKRQLSSNGLDLNVRADEDSSLTFLKKIKNSFVLNKGRDQEKLAKEMFLSKLTRAFEEGSGWKSVVNFNVDERVLEEVLKGAGSYLNSLFEEWLKDIFRTNIDGVNRGERGVSVRLCLEGKGDNGAKEGFNGTCLPKRIQVSFIG